MLDLNLSAVHNDNSAENLPEGSVGQMEESGTSNSSLLNNAQAFSNGGGGGDDDSSCSTRASGGGDIVGFNFGILKVGGDFDRHPENEDNRLTVTRQLFPVSGGGDRLMYGHEVSNSVVLGPNSMDLSFNQAKIVQQQPQQQQAKKSRRGPRSRSSQYRGVTFYRRTGRWESHIWYCFNFSFIVSFQVFTVVNVEGHM